MIIEGRDIVPEKIFRHFLFPSIIGDHRLLVSRFEFMRALGDEAR